VINYPLIEKARAKINLTLHVGPPSADGYHPLQSLVVFADIGDVLEMRPAQGTNSTMTIDGPFSEGLEANVSNLVLQTAQVLSDEIFDFKLTKNLPIASGIGGGSADAAATARLLRQANHAANIASLVELGADIPVCVASQTCLMEGRGERLTALSDLGGVHAVLVNPGVAVSTGEIFKLFDKTNPQSSNLDPKYRVSSDLLEMAKLGRNDLQDVAVSMAPEISTILALLNAQEELARMSGSGATCFGLFTSKEGAQNAKDKISKSKADWWCEQTVLGNQS